MKIQKGPFILFIIILLGLILRIYNLGRYSFWYDEAFSIFSSKYCISLSRLREYWGYHANLPLFDILLHLWMPLGKGEFAILQ